jgi:hypothetical protein
MLEQTECGLKVGDQIKVVLPKDDFVGYVGRVYQIPYPRCVTVSDLDDGSYMYCVAALEKCA